VRRERQSFESPPKPSSLRFVSNKPGTLRPLKPARSLAEDAADLIRETILGGGFSAGQHLVESKIAEQLKISRGPVREAFGLLCAEGLLVDEPRRGTFVVRLTPDDAVQIYGLRAALEAHAARLIARSRDPAALDRLSQLAARIDASVTSGDTRAVARADLAFHEGLCQLCGNNRIHDVFVRYIPMVRSLLHLDQQMHQSLDEVASDHQHLVDALAAEDPETAARAFNDHAERAGALIGR
jgi:GntR family transcriptional regulator of gluconate operon